MVTGALLECFKVYHSTCDDCIYCRPRAAALISRTGQRLRPARVPPTVSLELQSTFLVGMSSIEAINMNARTYIHTKLAHVRTHANTQHNRVRNNAPELMLVENIWDTRIVRHDVALSLLRRRSLTAVDVANTKQVSSCT